MQISASVSSVANPLALDPTKYTPKSKRSRDEKPMIEGEGEAESFTRNDIHEHGENIFAQLPFQFKGGV